MSVPLGKEAIENPSVDMVDDNDIFKYVSKYCVTDSSEDDDQKEEEKEHSISVVRRKENNLNSKNSSSVTDKNNTIFNNKPTLESRNIVRESLVCDVVECTVGYRTFRLTAGKILSKHNGKICFEEITNKETVEEGKINGHKKRRI